MLPNDSNQTNVLGVIPARGGSKGVPMKNIHPLAGKPLITYTIHQALAAAALDRVVVSTDNGSIAAVARQCDVQVVDRPPELALEATLTEPVLLHAVDVLARSGFTAHLVVTLEPTSPLRTTVLIDRCVQRLRQGDCDAVFTVTETRGIYGRIQRERFAPFIPDQPRRRQDREPVYRESSTVYATRVDALRTTGSVFGHDPVAIVVDEAEAIDLNTPLDFEMAEAILRRKGEHHDSSASPSR